MKTAPRATAQTLSVSDGPRDTSADFKFLTTTHLALSLAFLSALVVAIFPDTPLLSSGRLLVHLLQLVATYSVSAAKSVDPAGRPALILMVLFGAWFVGTMVFWRDAEHAGAARSEQQEILAVCEQLAAAEVEHDEETIRDILHEDFQFTDEDGTTMGKLEFVHLTRHLHARSQELFPTPVRIEGSRAFLQGTAKILPRSVRDESLTYEFVTTFARIDGQWKVVAQQITLPQGAAVGNAPDQKAA